MLSFDNLSILDAHLAFLAKKLDAKTGVFCVGGCIRDLLLGLTKRPLDVDITMSGNPIELYAKIDKKDLSHFITEKFGTITLLRKTTYGQVKYELTPLRTEWDYGDFRHPGEITWSNDVVLDSQRRDFTINAMYYFSPQIPNKKIKKSSKLLDTVQLKKSLDRQGVAEISEQNLLILQDQWLIAKLFADGIYHEDQMKYIINAYNLSLDVSGVRCLLDPQKGIQDLLQPVIRAVGEPGKRFTEDALRIIRALRFVSVLNESLKKNTSNGSKIVLFDIKKETRNSLKEHYLLVEKVAKERIKEELIKVFTHGNPFGFISLLDEAGILLTLFPALAATKYIHQPIRYHPFDVYTHTLLCLHDLQERDDNYLVRFAMLYHDVWKVAQFASYHQGLSREEIREILAWPLNHRRWWSVLVETDFRALWFSKKEIEEIERYVAHHHVLEEVLFAKPEYREKKIRKLLSSAWYDRMMHIINITISDRLWQYNPLQVGGDISDVEEIAQILTKIQNEEGQFTLKHLALNGNDLKKELKLPAGPLIWELMQQALDRVLGDIQERNSKKELLKYLKAYLKNKK